MKLNVVDRVLMLYASIFGRPIFEGLNKFVLQCGMRGLGCMNWQTDYLSGETAFAANVLKDCDRPQGIVIDVGANEGDFIQVVLNCTRYVTVVGIEPHPKTFERLSARFAGNPRVKLHQCGVGNSVGTAMLFDHSNHTGSEQASLLPGAIDKALFGPTTQVEVAMTRIDDLTLPSSSVVTMVKIDVEGFELEVLKGAQKTLELHHVPIVLLEFNEMNVESRTFFQDIRKVLTNYCPSRILPGGKILPLNGYGAWKEEIFAYQNVAFFHKSGEMGKP